MSSTPRVATAGVGDPVCGPPAGRGLRLGIGLPTYSMFWVDTAGDLCPGDTQAKRSCSPGSVAFRSVPCIRGIIIDRYCCYKTIRHAPE